MGTDDYSQEEITRDYQQKVREQRTMKVIINPVRMIIQTTI